MTLACKGSGYLLVLKCEEHAHVNGAWHHKEYAFRAQDGAHGAEPAHLWLV